jgi:hypothetical protein
VTLLLEESVSFAGLDSSHGVSKPISLEAEEYDHVSPGSFLASSCSCLASDGRSSQITASLENRMSFLQKSDLKKHLSTKSGESSHHVEPKSPGDARVVLRDGNLVTLPIPIAQE